MPGSSSTKALALSTAAAALAVAGLAYFMRDPERQPPDDPRAILAPADGRVLLVETAAAPAFVAGPAWRIVIFLSVWDVHVQRAPCAGRVALSERQAGEYAQAFDARAAHNASHYLLLETAHGPALVVRTVGLLARRQACWSWRRQRGCYSPPACARLSQRRPGGHHGSCSHPRPAAAAIAAARESTPSLL